MQPEIAIDSWHLWSGELRSRPVILRPLSGGRSNRSFLLDSGGSQLVLRLNGAEAVLPGAGRRNETLIWREASKQGIAPPLLHVDDQYRFLVSAFINNQLPAQPPFSGATLHRVFDLLKRCHALEVEAHDIDYASHIEHYWKIIETRGQLSNLVLNDNRKSMQSVLETLINSDTPTGLCHHDPVVANFVGNPEKLYLIDWEYAAQGLLIMDYAALAVEWKINDARILEQTANDPELLSMAKALYRYLCDLWEELNA